ncbi:hypothetical protein GTO89_14005 [Heliobacterium gestii]|uniref:Membrane protein YkvI n=1 Tax=Heliomicrobium gestii TaxID=2699 RepID=A0A845LHU6_HELGE|nr:hypothetical protein [Heliomicrobium gestii]MBM7867756.1 putative membrane protein YkvI [Heliomicrobium gestii]MZP44149.1 hypothetical protein [Heliomicrobium gestii]
MGALWQVQVASVYIGAVLGAGFASGQEIFQFFVRYGPAGLQAVLLSAALFGLLGPAIFFVCRIYRISRYQDLLDGLFGAKIGKVMDGVITFSLFVGVMVMLSGSGALMSQQWGWPPWTGVAATTALILLSLWWGIDSLIWVNTILVPLKSIICLAVALAIVLWTPSIDEAAPAALTALNCLAGWANPQTTVAEPNALLPDSPALSGFLYVSFNLTMSLVVLVALAPQVRRRGGYAGAAAGGLLLGLFAYLLTLAMLRYVPEIAAYPVPMLFLAGALHPWTGQVYAFLLWLAMFTAALGSAFGAALRLAKADQGPDFRQKLILSVLSVCPFAMLPFADLVATLYPFFGYVGLPLVLAVAWVSLKELWRRMAKEYPFFTMNR